MKKRIIGILLLAVMLTLSLVSCGYSFADEDYSQYADFEDKKAFETALTQLVIEDGDFSRNEDTRKKKVADAIIEALAKKANTDEKIKAGVVSAPDKFYYCYYATAVVGGTEKVLLTSNMKEASPSNMQFGISDVEGLQAKIEEAFAEVDINGKTYSTTTSGKLGADDKTKDAFISYKVEYQKDGKTENDTYTLVKVNLADNDDVVKKLVEKTKEIGKTIDSFEITKDNVKYKYLNAKIDFIVEGGEAVTFTDKTYTEDKTLKDVEGQDVKVKDVELTYYVYPLYYVDVEEFNATSVLKTIYSALTEADEEDADKQVSVLECLKGEEALLKAIDELKKTYSEKLTAVADAEEDVEKAKETLTEAKEAEKPSETTIKNAEDNLKKLEGDLKKAKEAATKAEKAIDDKIAELLKKKADYAEKITAEYEKTTRESLLEAYNDEVRNNLAKEIWALIKKHVKVTGTPDAAVQATFDRIYEEHEYIFYEGTKDSSSGQSNYAFYGTFEAYLKAVTGKTTEKDTFEDAKHKVWADAVEYVTPIVQLFRAAEVYGQKITAEDFNAFKDDPDSSYSYYEYYNGDENVKVAIQFDKLLDFFLETEEVKDKPGDVKYTNKLIAFKWADEAVADK